MDFQIIKNKTYLDTARSGGIYTELINWRKSHEKKFYEMGSEFRFDYDIFIEGVRKSISMFFGSKKNSTFLTQSFSVGFNSILSLLKNELKFLVYKNDYPSIIRSLNTNGFDCCYFDIHSCISEDILLKIKEKKPDVLAISFVQYLSGISIDPNFFLGIKRLHPELLIIVDGTQFCGTKKFNFDESGIDVLISSGYKWIYSGHGNGFILLKLDRLKNFLKKRFRSLNSDQLLSFLEPGNLDTLNFGSLKFSIDKMAEIGILTIEKKIDAISKIAKKRFIDLGLLDPIIKNQIAHSNIFNIVGDKKLYEKLLHNQIICSMRGNGIRVSFGMFNSEKDLDKLIDCIES